MTAAADVVIRPFTAEDRPAVIALLDSDPWRRLGYSAADWNRLLTTPLEGREGLVLVADGAVSGLALVRRNFLAGDYLELFAVAAGVRGRGLGAVLLGHLEPMVFARARHFFVRWSACPPSARARGPSPRATAARTSARSPTCSCAAVPSCCCERAPARSADGAITLGRYAGIPARLALTSQSAAASRSSVPCPRGVFTRRSITYCPDSVAASGAVASQMPVSAPCAGVRRNRFASRMPNRMMPG